MDFIKVRLYYTVYEQNSCLIYARRYVKNQALNIIILEKNVWILFFSLT